MTRQFLNSMSGRQHALLITGICLMAVLLSVGLIQEIRIPQKRISSVSTHMTIRQIAPKLGVTGKALARELALPLNANKHKPLNEMGIRYQRLIDVVNHLIGHRSSPIKYYLFSALVLWGWLFLTQIGRPEKMALNQRKGWYPRLGYTIPLLASVIVAGFLLGKSPTPWKAPSRSLNRWWGFIPMSGKK